jgi:YggT family protein
VAKVLADIISLVFQIFSLLLLARILISWVQLDPYNPIVQFLHSATEPVLAPIRRRLPPTGMFDLSPLVAIIGAMILQQILIQLVYSLF